MGSKAQTIVLAINYGNIALCEVEKLPFILVKFIL